MIDSQILDKLKRTDLLNLAKALRLSGCARMSRADLITFIRTSASSSGGESTPASETAAPALATTETTNDVPKPRGRRGRKSADATQSTPETPATPTPSVEQTQPAADAPVVKPRGRRGRKSADATQPTPEAPVAPMPSVEQTQPAPETPVAPTLPTEPTQPAAEAPVVKPRGRRGRKSAVATQLTPETPAASTPSIEQAQPATEAPATKPRGRRGRKSAVATQPTPETQVAPAPSVDPTQLAVEAPSVKPRGRRGRKSSSDSQLSPEATVVPTPPPPEKAQPTEEAPAAKPRGRHARKSAHDSETPLFDVLTTATVDRLEKSDEAARNSEALQERPEGADETSENDAAQPEKLVFEEAATPEPTPETPVKKRGRKRRVQETPEIESAPTSESAPNPQTSESATPSSGDSATVERATKTRSARGRRPKSEKTPSEAPPAGEPFVVAPIATSDAQEEPKPRRKRRKVSDVDATNDLSTSKPARDEIDTTSEPAVEKEPEEEEQATEARKPVPVSGSSLDVKTNDLKKLDADDAAENARRRQVFPKREKSDRLLLIVCDPHWLRACWETSDALLERVRAAMGRHWHTADSVLRVYRVQREMNGSTLQRETVADVVVQLELNNWYVQVDNPPQQFMVELGYLARNGQFFTLASSNIVTTPQRYIHDAFSRPVFNPVSHGFDPNPYRSGDRIGRPRLESNSGLPTRRRSLGSNLEIVQPVANQNGRFGARLTDDFSPYEDKLQVEVDAEVIIRGKVSEGASVKVKEEPIIVNSEGAFAVRFSLPERRHVYPVVATSGDGVAMQTIIIAIDRNTKTLGPVFREDED